MELELQLRRALVLHYGTLLKLAADQLELMIHHDVFLVMACVETLMADRSIDARGRP